MANDCVNRRSQLFADRDEDFYDSGIIKLYQKLQQVIEKRCVFNLKQILLNQNFNLTQQL